MQKQELLLKLFLAVLYVSSLVSIGLWMAGYLGTERVNYTRFGEINAEINAKKELKEYTQEIEQPKIAPLDTSFDHESTEEVETIGSSEESESEPISEPVSEPEVALELDNVAPAEVNLEQDSEPAIEVQPNPEMEIEVHKELEIAYNLADLEASMNWSHFTPIRVSATGYTAGPESTGKDPDHPQYGITYSGVQVRRDLYSTIAADTDVFPLGTILYIPRYGYGVVADIGSAITGNKLDLYYETVEDVYNLWGKQEVEVYLIQKGDGKVTEAMLDELNGNGAQLVFKQE